jgi:hypothetical protein
MLWKREKYTALDRNQAPPVQPITVPRVPTWLETVIFISSKHNLKHSFPKNKMMIGWLVNNESETIRNYPLWSEVLIQQFAWKDTKISIRAAGILMAIRIKHLLYALALHQLAWLLL